MSSGGQVVVSTLATLLAESHPTSVYALTKMPLLKTEFLGVGKALKATALHNVESLRAGYSLTSTFLPLESLCDMLQVHSTLTTHDWKQWLSG